MRSWLFLALCYPMWGCDDGDMVPSDGDGVASEEWDFSAFDAQIDQFVTDNGLAGASAVVVHRERGIVHKAGYGAFDADRVYAIASSSKILSVGVLMRLQDEGLIDIDTPIGAYVDDVFGQGHGELTVAQLVSNSSGLVSLADNAAYAPYICQYRETGTLSDCAAAIYTADDAMDIIEPDTEFHYGGGQWQLAGGVAEVVSGKSWAELVEETYVARCGTETLGYTNEFGMAGIGYPDYFEGDIDNLTVTDNPSIEGGAYVSAEDYGTLLWMHLRGGLCGETRVLSEDAVARMQDDRILQVYEGSTGVATMDGYGLGWWIDRMRPGVVVDGGAYGAMPWIDNARGYAAFLVMEETSTLGAELMVITQPLLEAIFD